MNLCSEPASPSSDHGPVMEVAESVGLFVSNAASRLSQRAKGAQ